MNISPKVNGWRAVNLTATRCQFGALNAHTGRCPHPATETDLHGHRWCAEHGQAFDDLCRNESALPRSCATTAPSATRNLSPLKNGSMP